MKSMLKILLPALALIAITGPAQATEAIHAFACEPQWSALLDEIGAGHVHAYTAITAQQDAHYIQARPSLIARVRDADLLVCTGAKLEVGWLPLLLRRSTNGEI